MLRIEVGSFAWRDPEEGCVEQLDVFQEPAPFGVGLADRVGIRIKHVLHVPAPRRYLGHGIHALDQIAPECVRAVGTGEAATDADDGDRLVLGHFDLRQLGL